VAQVWSIVVAGGAGRRFGQRKQFALLGGRPVATWAVAACRASSDGVVLVVPAGAGDGADHGADVVVEGEATRAGSVRRGLAAVPTDAAVIVVHDAARPLATEALCRAVVAAVEGGADAAIPAVPVRDTIKVVDGDQTVTATLERSTLVAVQTPQAFAADLLRRAHADGAEATDDAALAERLGATVRVVPGEERNVKITTPDDLRAAEHTLLGER
jgi:2-C-methyl-D-erythritol 4-phosphate cytidylyltransferase